MSIAQATANAIYFRIFHLVHVCAGEVVVRQFADFWSKSFLTTVSSHLQCYEKDAKNRISELESTNKNWLFKVHVLI